MKSGNFLLIYIILSLLLLFPINVLGEKASNDSMKDPEGKFGYKNQRKLEDENENYISIIFGENVLYDSFKTITDRITGEPINFREFSQIVYNGETFNDLENSNIEANQPLEIHFLSPIESLESFFNADYDPNCGKIKYVDLSHFDSSALKRTNYMFYKCTSIQSINFTNFKTTLVKNMNKMFFNCKALVSLDLSNFNTSLVTDMSSMFYSCEKLVSLDFSNFNTSLVTDMSSMFYSCEKLVSLDLSTFDISSVKDLSYMFYSDYSLEYLDISNFNLDLDILEDDDSMFSEIEESIKYISIYNIKSEYMKGKISDLLKEKDYCFICQSENIITNNKFIYTCCDFRKNLLQCDNNNYIEVKYKDAKNYSSGFSNENILSRNKISYIINQKSLLGIKEPLSIEANNSIEIHFSNEIENLENFFNGEFDDNSKSIIYADLSHLNTSLVTSTSKMFHLCKSIEEINFTNFDSSSIESMSYMFSECSSLELIDLSNFNTEKVKNMSGIFS